MVRMIAMQKAASVILTFNGFSKADMVTTFSVEPGIFLRYLSINDEEHCHRCAQTGAPPPNRV